MITRAVTQDIYGNTHIYRYPTYTYSDSVSGKCSKCGKKINKSFSVQYQGKPTESDYQYIEEQKQKWLSEEHICTKCLKEACKGNQEIIDTSEIESCIAVIKDREEQMKALRKEISLHCNLIADKIKGKVCLYNEKEYVIEYISYIDPCDSYYFYGHKIDERYPWTTTEKQIYINETGKGLGSSKSDNCKFSEVTFTNEVFEERRNRLEELEEKEERSNDI